MLQSIFATKMGMTQVWDTSGKRWAVTKCKVGQNIVLGEDQSTAKTNPNANVYLIGFGRKKQKNMSKPLRTIVNKSGFSFGVKQIKGISLLEGQESTPETGTTIRVEDVLSVGDVVKVRGTSKGRGFAGAMKRHGFHGGPRTHGQSDRERAVGSIGAGTTPGKVWKGKKMPGHYGDETKMVTGLVVLHIDSQTQEVWLSGPVPGSRSSTLQIFTVGKKKQIELDLKASGIKEEKVEEVAEGKPASEEVTEDKANAAKEVASEPKANAAKETNADEKVETDDEKSEEAKANDKAKAGVSKKQS